LEYKRIFYLFLWRGLEKEELRYGWDAHLEFSDQTPPKYLTSVYLKRYP
jgi:hypothetical protein